MVLPTGKLEMVDLGFCLPLALIINFSLFQYLLTTFWKRRDESRVRVLLVVAILGFLSLVPFALPYDDLSYNRSGFSGVCTVLTFLLQITILTRDVGRRLKIHSIWMLMWAGEFLTLVCLGLLVTNVVILFAPVIDVYLVEKMDAIARKVSIAYVVGFRFYFLAMIKGWHKIVSTHKLEVFFYLLFFTYTWPFVALKSHTGWEWENVEEAWMRVTVAACLSTTIRSRFKRISSKPPAPTTGGPGSSQCDAGYPVKKIAPLGPDESLRVGVHKPVASSPKKIASLK